MTELVGNLQAYELGLIRIGKTGKGKSMALKANSSKTNESSDDEDSKKNANGKGFDKDRKLSSSSQFKG